MKSVSIIVPVYNSTLYLENCLNSLVSQTLMSIEIVCVNDGSTDQSLQILNDYLKRYPDKIIVSSKENGGLGDARNHGLKLSNGEYIGFVDSDDYVSSTMFEKLYEQAKKEDSDIVECQFNWVYPDHVITDSITNYQSKQDYLANLRVLVCNKLFKRELIIENNLLFPVNTRYEDIPFSYVAVASCKRYSFIDHVGYFYVQRPNSLSNFQNKHVRDIFEILKCTRQQFISNHFYDEYESEIEYLFIRILLGSSFKRIIQIKDKTLRNELLLESWNILKATFPNWKKNRYLKSFRPKNIYFRLLSYPLYRLNAMLLRGI